MSCNHYRWAWAQPLKGNRLLVLLNLAERANEDGQCYPSIARITQDTGLNRKTVIAALQDLEAAGLICKRKETGTSTRYLLNLTSQGEPVPETVPVPKSAPVPETGRGRPKNGTATSPENGTQNPPLNPPLNPEEGTAAKSASDPPAITPPPSSAKPRKRSRPKDFAISDAVRRWAEHKGYADLEAHFENFTEKADARGYQYVDWDAALRTAIREDWAGLRSQPPYRTPRGATRHGTHQPPVSAVERCRQSADDWHRAKQQAVIVDLGEYRTA